MSDHSNDEPPDDGFDHNNFDNIENTGNRQTMNDDNILGTNAFKNETDPNVNYGGQNSNGFDYAPEETSATNN